MIEGQVYTAKRKYTKAATFLHTFNSYKTVRVNKLRTG